MEQVPIPMCTSFSIGIVRKLATVGTEPTLTETARILATLPLKYGGLGLPDYLGQQPHARRASRDLYEAVEHHIETFKERPTKADKSMLLDASPPPDRDQYIQEQVEGCSPPWTTSAE
jgi:hypothetical protein